MSSTLGDLLREVAEPGPNRNSFHLNGTLPVRYRARTRAGGRMEDKIRSRILPDLTSPIQAISRLRPTANQ